MLLENLKVRKLLINGEEYYCDNITEIMPPTDLNPWWQFNLADGSQIWASGNVMVVLEEKEKEKK